MYEYTSCKKLCLGTSRRLYFPLPMATSCLNFHDQSISGNDGQIGRHFPRGGLDRNSYKKPLRRRREPLKAECENHLIAREGIYFVITGFGGGEIHFSRRPHLTLVTSPYGLLRS